MDKTTVVTNECRFSFVHVFDPYAYDPTQTAKYSLTILIPKSDDVTLGKIAEALVEAEKRGVETKWGGKKPAVVANPIYDGDGVRPNGEPFGPECKGHYVLTASAKADRAPEVVDANGVHIDRPSEVYSGCYGRVCINFFAYANTGKKGIGAGLGPVQKLRDGEPLGGSAPSAAAAFGAPEGSAAAAFSSAPKINPLTGKPE